MLLRRHASLGRLPAAVALAFLGATAVALGITIMMVGVRTPVLLVPDAEGVSRLSPARADGAYQRAFANAFLQNWETWNATSCAPRRAIAVAMLAPALRGACAADTASALQQCLLQSQDLVVDALQVAPSASAPSVTEVSFQGELTQYFGGVGGYPDRWAGRLWLRAITPSAAAPWCLEVLGVDLHALPGVAEPLAVLR
jgi:hypothetical protein